MPRSPNHLLPLLLLLGCPAEEPSPPEPAPAPALRDPVPSDQPGPYAVSATTLEGLDDRGKWMVMEVWYPALLAEGAEREPYAGLNLGDGAFRDQPWDARRDPFPVVVFSHGYGGIRFQSGYLTEWLASHGFVVVAPDHEHNTLLDLDSRLVAQVAAERPGDLAAAVDRVEEELGDLVDLAGGYAVVGHSFGAWTSLVLGGGQLDADALLAHCADNDDAGCGFFEGEDVASLTDLAQAAPDPRAAVAVALAPGLAYSFGEGGAGLAGNVPTLVQGGDRDSDMPYDSEIRPAWEALPDSSALLTLRGAAYFGFSDLCSSLPLGGECEGEAEGYMEIARVHHLSRALTTAWIRARWRGEESEEALLTADWIEAAGDATWER